MQRLSWRHINTLLNLGPFHMIFENSYGIVPVRKNGDIWMVLLIQHSTAHYWGFPKGHADIGESPKDAAIRELKEETNLDVVKFISDSMIEEHYFFTFQGKRISKSVGYFVGEVNGDLILQDLEISGSKWILFDDAVNHLTYETDKIVLANAKNLLKNKSQS
jgi:bis(5'-nucleosidyl)-tetraphosphatase